MIITNKSGKNIVGKYELSLDDVIKEYKATFWNKQTAILKLVQKINREISPQNYVSAYKYCFIRRIEDEQVTKILELIEKTNEKGLPLV